MMKSLFKTLHASSQMAHKVTFNISIGDHVVKKGYLLPKPPARPLSTYALYTQIKAKDFEGKTIGEMASSISTDYKNATKDADLKKKLTQESEAQRSKYEKLKAAYDEKYGLPKGHVSTFAQFVSKYKGTEATAVDRMKAAAVAWKKVSAAEKTKLEKEIEKISGVSQKQKEKLEGFKIPLVHTRLSGYNVFVAEYTSGQTNAEQSRAEVLKEAAGKWKALADAKKEEFNAKAVKQAEKSKADFESFCAKHKVPADKLATYLMEEDKNDEEPVVKKASRSKSVSTSATSSEKKKSTTERKKSASPSKAKSEAKESKEVKSEEKPKKK